MRTDSGWHQLWFEGRFDPDSMPDSDRLVLCQGASGGLFLGQATSFFPLMFHVPNYSGGCRGAVAWHELPEPWDGRED